MVTNDSVRKLEELKDQIEEQIENATPIYKLTPIDVSGVDGHEVRALLRLAVSMGWNVSQRADSPAVITARDGVQRRFPTNSGLRMSVFQSFLRAIMYHALDKQMTPELVEEVIASEKLSKDHQRYLRLAASEWAERRMLPDPEPPAKERREPEPHLTQRIEIPMAKPEPEPEPQPATAVAGHDVPPLELGSAGWEMAPSKGLDLSTLERRPALVLMGQKKRGSGISQQYISPIMDEITLPSGEVTRICKICDFTGTTQRIASHYQWHVRRGEAPTTNSMKRIAVAEVVKQPRKYTPADTGSSDELRQLRQIIDDIAAVVGRRAIYEAETRAKRAEFLQHEAEVARDAAIARAEKLAGDLRSLRDLLNGVE